MLNLRLTGYDFDLYLSRHKRNTILWHIAEIVAHIGWCNGYVLNQFLLHLLNELIVAEVVVELRAELCNAHLLIFFQFLA